MINALTTRTQKWLGRSDLSLEEMEEACSVLTHLASSNADTGSWAVARELYTEAAELSLRGLGLQPHDALFGACAADAKTGLGYAEVEGGDTAKGIKLYEESQALLDGWRGEPTPELRMARAELDARWGSWAWGRDPDLGRRLFIGSAEAVLPLLGSDDVKQRHEALARGANAVSALWSEGKLQEATALAKRFYEAAARDCADQTVSGQRTCLSPVSTYASIVSWVDPTEAARVRKVALSVDAFVHAHDVDSNEGIYDSMVMFMELGLYAESTQRAPLTAVLSGDLAEASRRGSRCWPRPRREARWRWACATPPGASTARRPGTCARCSRGASGSTSPGCPTRSRSWSSPPRPTPRWSASWPTSPGRTAPRT